MSDKNYFKNIKTSLNIFVKYYRVFRFFVIVAYLFFLAMKVIDVTTAVEYVPSATEVGGKFLPIAAKNDVISSIEKYFFDRENKLTENWQTETIKDPFASQKVEKTDNANSPVNTIVPQADIIN